MIEQPAKFTTQTQRVIRVFVSSTFRDMQAERDELVKRTFPQLRKLCDERNVVWSEVSALGHYAGTIRTRRGLADLSG